MPGGYAQDSREVDAAFVVSRHREHAELDCLEERQVLGHRLPANCGAHVLRVNVDDTIHVSLGQRCRIGTGERGVPGVEQKPCAGAGVRHERLDVRPALDHGSHMVMVGEADAVTRAVCGDRLHVRAERGPAGGIERRSVRERRVECAVNGAGRFAGDAGRTPQRLQHFEMRLDLRGLVRDGSFEQSQGMPA